MKDDSAQKPQWVCMTCARTHPRDAAQGFCPVHVDEPLLDGTVDAVRFQMMEADDKARSRAYGFWITVMAGLFTLATAVFVVVVDLPDFLIKWLFVGTVASGVGLGTAIAKMRHTPRFRQWTLPVDPGED